MKRITTHPGIMLYEEFMKPYDMSSRELGRALDVPHNRISEVVAGRRAVSADTALRLERYFGMEAEFWLNLQLKHDLTKAKQEGSYKQIKPRKVA